MRMRAASRCAIYMLYRLAGGAPHQISFLANTNVNSIQWSPDGKYVLYETGQRTETPEVARIDLTPRQPEFAEEKFDDLFKPEPARAGRGAKCRRKAASEAGGDRFR